MMRHRVQCMIWVVTVLLSIPLSGESQSPRPKLEGMWSDPPSSAVGAFCTFACTDAGLDRLNAPPADGNRAVLERWNIDGKNPTYAGQLGHGRINVFSAVKQR